MWGKAKAKAGEKARVLGVEILELVSSLHACRVRQLTECTHGMEMSNTKRKTQTVVILLSLYSVKKEQGEHKGKSANFK
jgi:hypothetical protein